MILQCFVVRFICLSFYIYIFIAIALDESIFLDVLHFQINNIKSCDLEATSMCGATLKAASDERRSRIVMTLSAKNLRFGCSKITSSRI